MIKQYNDLMSRITLFRVVSILNTHMFYLSVICLSILSETFDRGYIITVIIMIIIMIIIIMKPQTRS